MLDLKRRGLADWITAVAVLMALWFIMSQRTEPKFLIIGAASSVVIASVCIRILTIKGMKSDDRYYVASVNPFRFFLYFFWLLWQIVKSAVYVSKVSIFDIKDVDPHMVRFKADYDSPAARSVLANSITLTPGTITVDLTDDGIYTVHALTNELKDGLLDGSMQSKVAWLYGESIECLPMISSQYLQKGDHE